MIGQLNVSSKSATIVGAGLSGLLMAYRLDRLGWEVTLLEASPRAGGLIETKQTENGIVETAAHSLLVTPEVEALCDELGVELLPVNRESRARYVLRGGKLRKFPLTFFEAIKLFFKAYFVVSRTDVSNGRATMADWGRRHLGRPAVTYLLSPFLTGIFASKPEEVSVEAAFPQLAIPPGHSLLSFLLWKFRKKRRKPRPKLMVPQNGMGELVEKLDAYLERSLGTRFRKNTAVERLPQAPNLILCVPANVAARLLAQDDPALAKKLESLRYAPLVTATVFVPKDAFEHAPPRGVGVLIPEEEGRKCLGILFNSSAFPERARNREFVSLTVMLGETALSDIDIDLDRRVVGEISDILKIRTPDARIQVISTKWARAIPQYGPEILDLWAAARSGWCSGSGRVLFGNYTGQVSIRGMIQDVSSDIVAT